MQAQLFLPAPALRPAAVLIKAFPLRSLSFAFWDEQESCVSVIAVSLFCFLVMAQVARLRLSLPKPTN